MVTYVWDAVVGEGEVELSDLLALQTSGAAENTRRHTDGVQICDRVRHFRLISEPDQ